MLKLAVIGRDVSHSHSPLMHAFLFRKFQRECVYDKISVSPEEFSSAVDSAFERYDGLNVTVPYKAAIIPKLKGLCGAAARLNAVNTVLTENRLGYNTDFDGFSQMLAYHNVDPKGKRVLVLGAGGAGRSCIEKLKSLGASVSVYERDEALCRAVFERFGGFLPLETIGKETYEWIVNCTGIGMNETEGQVPRVRTCGGEKPVTENCFQGAELAIDLIYEPETSAFLEVAKSENVKTLNGSAMLFFQAYLSDCLFLQRPSKTEEACRFYDEYQAYESSR